MHCSGSTRVHGSLHVFEDFHSSGMLAVGDQLQIDQDFHSSGSMNVGGNLFVRQDARVTGNLHCDGSVIAQTVIMRGIGLFNFGYTEILGHVYAANSADLRRTIVGGDVYARDVKIGDHVTVNGTIYYTGDLKIHPNAELLNQPVKITEGQLHGYRKNLPYPKESTTETNQSELPTTMESQTVKSMPAFCSECGGPVSPPGIYCPYCGKKLMPEQ